MIRQLNEAALPTGDTELAARIAAYDLAFKMQTEAPEVFDLSGETQATLDLYGVGKQPTDDYARRCLMARRLVERGVRFNVVVSGGGPGNKQWDAHNDIEENHLRMAGETDQPVAALLTELAGGLSLLLGHKARLGALALFLFLIPVTLTFHNFWTYTDPKEQQVNMLFFMHNLTLMGGLLLLMTIGPGPKSIDVKERSPV